MSKKHKSILLSIESITNTKTLDSELEAVVSAIVGAVDKSDVDEALFHLKQMFQEVIKKARFDGYLKGKEEGINLSVKIKNLRIAIV